MNNQHVEPTQAVHFDPFADEPADPANPADPAEYPGTEAVAFDPFADDEDDFHDEPLGDMAGLLKEMESQRSRLKALDTFRERRGARRASRVVALSLIHISEPTRPAA